MTRGVVRAYSSNAETACSGAEMLDVVLGRGDSCPTSAMRWGGASVVVLALGACGGNVEQDSSAAGGSDQGGTAGTAGGGTDGGAGGTDGSSGPPAIGSQKSSKLDLLLVVDNSASMADKQALLSASSGDLIRRLINPPCVDAAGAVVDQPSSGTDSCSSGERRFPQSTTCTSGSSRAAWAATAPTSAPQHRGNNSTRPRINGLASRQAR